MFLATIYYEGLNEGDNVVVLRATVKLAAQDRQEAGHSCNRITSRGVRIGSWFVPAHRIIGVYLREVSNGKSVKAYEEGSSGEGVQL